MYLYFCGGYPLDGDQRSTSSKVRTQDKNQTAIPQDAGFASILIPNEDVDRVLKLDLSVAGYKFRVAKWRSSKGPVHRAPAVATTNRRNGHQASMKEQARFVMEFLDAQAARPADRRLYSQAAAPNTSEARMKAMETVMVGWILW